MYTPEQVARAASAVLGRLNPICNYDYQKAKDLLQDTLLRFYTKELHLRQFESSVPGRDPLQSVLYRIARNLVIDASRKNRIQMVFGDLCERTTGSLRVESPEALFVDRERSNAFYGKIDGLPGNNQSRVMRLWLQDYKFKEIVELTGLNPGTVSSTIHYAKQKLAAHLVEFRTR